MNRFDTITIFDKLIAELGVPHGQFDHELTKFCLSPRAWLEERLRAMGWVKVLPVGEVKCERECCR